MCGRFTLTTHDDQLVARAFDARFDPQHAASFRPRYNIAPSDRHWIVCIADEGNHRAIVPAVWGLLSPAGRRGQAPERTHINARSETAHQRPAFREAFHRWRCGVAADGFFEWMGPSADRQPCWFHTPDGTPLLFAGLYRDHVDRHTGEVTRRFTILTTEANALVAPYHDRMPVVLAPENYELWLAPAPVEAHLSLLDPAPAERLVATPVSKRVNSPRHDDPACIEPRAAPQQGRLF